VRRLEDWRVVGGGSRYPFATCPGREAKQGGLLASKAEQISHKKVIAEVSQSTAQSLHQEPAAWRTLLARPKAAAAPALEARLLSAWSKTEREFPENLKGLHVDLQIHPELGFIIAKALNASTRSCVVQSGVRAQNVRIQSKFRRKNKKHMKSSRGS
jgi:hypothetical protein